MRQFVSAKEAAAYIKCRYDGLNTLVTAGHLRRKQIGVYYAADLPKAKEEWRKILSERGKRAAACGKLHKTQWKKVSYKDNGYLNMLKQSGVRFDE